MKRIRQEIGIRIRYLGLMRRMKESADSAVPSSDLVASSDSESEEGNRMTFLRGLCLLRLTPVSQNHWSFAEHLQDYPPLMSPARTLTREVVLQRAYLKTTVKESVPTASTLTKDTVTRKVLTPPAAPHNRVWLSSGSDSGDWYPYLGAGRAGTETAPVSSHRKNKGIPDTAKKPFDGASYIPFLQKKSDNSRTQSSLSRRRMGLFPTHSG
ncbi:hypothetical protein Lal_00038465 [Lupinus albus]|nr:hypothetical protein Lal_00038465 [Lupinus albus]